MVDKLGFQDKAWVGPQGMEFEYVEYKVPVEDSFGFGGWKGLPNPLATVQTMRAKWGAMEEQLRELNLSMLPLVTEANRDCKVHPAALAGLQISNERFSAPPGGWPHGGGGSGILHPGAVFAEATGTGSDPPSADPFSEVREARQEKLVKMLESMKEVKEAIEEEFLGSNCAALQDTGLPRDGVPPKTGSLENLRALHHPSSKAVGFVRALLVVLGEPKGALGSWDKCRSHLVFRDQRNAWRNIHDRLESFDPAAQEHEVFQNAAQVLRQMGGEPAARKEWLSIYLAYKWVVLMMLMKKISDRIEGMQPGPPRPRVEPGDLPPPPEPTDGNDTEE